MTQRDRRAVALVAVLLGLGPASSLAQEQARPAAEAPRLGVPPELPTISWQPPEAAAGTVGYKVRVLEVEGQGQVGRSVWEQDLKEPKVSYAGPPLDAQRSYVWTMEALNVQGRTIAAGGGILGGTTVLPDLCIPFVVASAGKICQMPSQAVTLSGFLVSSQGGPTTYVLSDGTNTPASGTSTAGSIVLKPTPTTTTTYALTLKRGTCEASKQTTIVVVPPPFLGTVTCSGAATQNGPFTSSEAGICCGSGFGLQCQAAGPVVGNVQWTAGNSSVSGGAGFNINSSGLGCDPNMDKTIRVRATASTDPTVCPDVLSNEVPVTLYRPPHLSSVTVEPSAICADGVSTSQVGPPQQVVGTVTWTHLQGCAGSSQPFNPPSLLPFTVGPLREPDCYTVNVANGPCAPIVQNVRVDIDTPPVAGTIIAAPNQICPGDDSVFTLSSPSSKVQWYSSTTCTPGAVFASQSKMTGATGTVQNTNILRQTTCYGVQASSRLGVCPPTQMPIVPATMPNLPVAPEVKGPRYICPGQAVMLSSSASGQWYHNGDPVGPPPFSEPGNYWMMVNDTCGTADSNILTVNPDLLAVNIEGPCCDCSGRPVQLCATASQGVGQPSFVWNPGGERGRCIRVKPTATTTYTVTATDDASCAVSNSFVVAVCP